MDLHISVISFDFSKAFNSVPPDILFEEITSQPVCDKLITNFLQDCKQRVTNSQLQSI